MMERKHRKIGVLYVLDTLVIGGAEQLVLTLARSLDPERFHVVVCTLFSRGEVPEALADEIRSLGIRVEQLAMTRWRDFDTMTRFTDLIDEEQIDIVHGHTVPADFWGCFLAKILKRRKTIYTKHDRFPRLGRANRFQRFILDRILAERIVSISGVVTDHLIRYCGVRPGRIVQIPNPVDTERFRPDISGAKIRRELDIPDDVVVIGNTSRLIRLKGYHVFLEIAAAIVKRGHQVRFLIVGHGPEKDRLLKQMDELGLKEMVILTGPRRDIPEVMGAIDIFLFLSMWGEGFGITVIEAMASGKPVVAANVGPVSNLVEDGISGYLPYPSTWVPETQHLDIEPFVDKIEDLIRDPADRRRMGQAARARAVEHFGIRKVIKQTEALYEILIKGV